MEEIRCSVCGSVVNAGDAFCQNCGSPVTNAAQETGTGSQTESAAPEQQETTVLSGNPYSMNNDGTQPSPQNVAADVNTTASATGGTYQQPAPNAGANYQGSYNATYTQPVQTTPAGPSKGLGVAGLVLGIIGIITGCCFGGFIFGLIGLILSIIYVAKKGSKGLGIGGIITSALGLIFSIVMVILFVSAPSIVYNMMPDEYKYLIEDEFGGSTEDFNLPTEDFNFPTEDSGNNTSSGTNITNTDQIMINETVYTLPASVSSLGFTVDPDYRADEVAAIATEGVAPGDYVFVLLKSTDGTSFFGYIENTGAEDTIYSADELTVTGVNVDNYSQECTAYFVEAFGGIRLDMSRSEVEALIGTPDDTNDGMDVYESDSGYEVLRLEYENDYVIAVDLTTY